MTTMHEVDRDGTTYDRDEDYQRLNAQAKRVFDAMRDRQWHSLSELSAMTGDPESSISARLRDFRKPKCGSWRIESERFSGGWWRYRLAGKLDDGERLARQDWQARARAAEAKLEAVTALVQRQRAISSGERAVVYVSDVEAALGIDTGQLPHKLGQSDDE